MTRLQQILTAVLITLALCGTQVIQASPLHDHTGHITGCALCHFSANEAAIPATPVGIKPAEGPARLPVLVVSSHDKTSPSPFKSRAPPVTSL